MLATSIAGIQLDCCIYNASGPKSGHVSDLVNVGKSRSGAVLSKSATLEKRTGNELPRLNKIDVGGTMASINSEGLPNSGIEYYIGDKVLSSVAETGKPYLVSISGLKLANNLQMLSRIAEAHAAGSPIAAVELNLACPNIPGKPTVAYDFEQMRNILQQVTDHESFAASGLPLGVKLAPYFDMTHFDAACDLIVEHAGRINFVVSINTIGNALVVDAEAEMATIAPKGGFGGLGGSLVKQVAHANIRQLYLRLSPHNIDVVGVGGLKTGTDAFNMILCGAAAVQTATTHWLEGPACFERIASELEAIMKKKGYTSLDQFRGNLKNFDRALAKKTKAVVPAVSSSGGPVLMWQIMVAVLVVVVAVLLSREMGR